MNLAVNPPTPCRIGKRPPHGTGIVIFFSRRTRVRHNNKRWQKTHQKHKNTLKSKKSTTQTPKHEEKTHLFRAYCALLKNNYFCWYAQTTSNAGISRSDHSRLACVGWRLCVQPKAIAPCSLGWKQRNRTPARRGRPLRLRLGTRALD